MKRVGIFWDMENCNPSSQLSGITVALNIQRATSAIGDEISSFKAYADMGLESERKAYLQSELKDSGVTLVHCPHLAHKEVADKVILIDMFDFVIGCGEPSSVVLITGDRDFTYAVTILRKRGHDVYLIFPHRSYQGIRRVATGSLSWQSILESDGSDLTFTNSSIPMCSTSRPVTTDLNKRAINARKSDRLLPAYSGRRKIESAQRAALSDASNNGGRSFRPPNTRASGTSGDQPFANSGTSSCMDIVSLSDNQINLVGSSDASRIASQSGTLIYVNHGPSTLSIMDIDAYSGDLSCIESRPGPDKKTTALSSPVVHSTPANAGTFFQLVQVLLGERASGRMSTPCDILDELLRKSNPTLYAELGVGNFRAFIDLAQSASIVFFSDVFWENRQGWVSLRNPQLYGPNQVNVPVNSKHNPVQDQTVNAISAIDATLKQVPHSVTSRRTTSLATGGTKAGASRHNIPARSGSKFVRIIEILRELRNQGQKRVKWGNLRKPLMESDPGKLSKKEAKAYIELARTNGILCRSGSTDSDAFVELHPDFY